MARISIVTATVDETIIQQIAAMAGTNLVGARTDFTVWEWEDPDPTDLSTVEALAEYKGQIALS